jgi:WD40 repeat protein
MKTPVELIKPTSSRKTSPVTSASDNKAIGTRLPALIAGLLPVISILARRIAFSLLFVGASLALVQPSAGVSVAFGETGSLNIGRYAHTATLLPNGMVLVAGGYNQTDGDLASAELYDPETGTWTETGSLATARDGHTATLLPNGKVLVAGGYSNGSVLRSAELYDPASGTWTATSNLATKRYSHTATLLPNGKVLVAGGDNNGGVLASAELYDPGSGRWRATGSLNMARESHTTTLLPNGKVLVAGGDDNNNVALASAELGERQVAGDP